MDSGQKASTLQVELHLVSVGLTTVLQGHTSDAQTHADGERTFDVFIKSQRAQRAAHLQSYKYTKKKFTLINIHSFEAAHFAAIVVT